MRRKDVLISGAGIAGPALAYWLRSAGFEVTVVERAPAPRPGGQTVDLRGAGREVINRMGLMDRARAVAVEQRGLAMVDARDRVTAEMPASAFDGEGIVSEIEILRGDLARLLHDATAPAAGTAPGTAPGAAASIGVEYLFDDTVTALAQDDDGVTVTFENSGRRRFGVVVGADGPHSIVRALAFGPESDFVTPLNCWTAWFTARDDWDLGGWFRMFNAPGGLVASARPGRLPGEIKAGLSFRAEPFTYDRHDVGAQQRLITRRFEGVGWEVPRLLAAMRSSEDFFFDSLGQVRLDNWSRGRAVLLGDAGHCPSPLTGMGTSLALVGAYVLAGELTTPGATHLDAFRNYDRIMRPYVTRAQQLPPGGAGGYAPKGALAIRLRAASMRSMNRWPMRQVLAAQFAKAGDIDLPAYPHLAAGAGPGLNSPAGTPSRTRR
ncbi:FAD-dependent monooxygenase [Streptomyces sp. NBC_00102]|uniref:FAD-dependent monooxygenase n=1 Tax=Streptomyces sp. NBC_00102 TaxID=2975652 RepID=UPI00225348A8|nr:FAD-dependent monooxygenase [Streptomyces sp. NBC_00102]MCX5396666.1 FAD-dependent monooxygenase [Streptomyces sp. NBC_00102]